MQNIKKEYLLGKSKVLALRGVNLSIEKGELCSIVGPSGSGKSSLLHIIGCLDIPTSGSYLLEGKSIQETKESRLCKIRAEAIGFVFQAFHLNPILTALDNVALGLRFIGKRKNEARLKAKEWLSRVGLTERFHHFPQELSGGERQRVAIARALVKNPLIVLADEPSGNLDSNTGKQIIKLLKELNRENSTTIIQVTHNMEWAKMSDGVYTLKDGILN